MIFQLSTLMGAVAVACFPRHRIGDTSPLLYADLLDFQTRADIRKRKRSIVTHSHSTHRHARAHGRTRDRPHGLSGSSTNYKGTYFKAKEIYNAQKNNHNRAAKAPPNTVNPQSIQSQQLPCCLSFSSKQEAATALAYRATTGCIPNKPIRNPPNRCFHRLLSLKKSITVPITILSLILKKSTGFAGI